MNEPDLGIHNPMWEQLSDFVGVSPQPWRSGLVIGGETGRVRDFGLHPRLWAAEHRDLPKEERIKGILEQASWLEKRTDYVRRYAWTVTDPWSVQFVNKWSAGRIIDPMAGTGYWGYLLHQLGVDVALFDDFPPTAHGSVNHYHPRTDQFLTVNSMHAADAVKAYGQDRTLLLAWPPMDPGGYHTLLAYPGDTVIHIGELGGCTGDGHLVAELHKNWNEVDVHQPVQFFGINDVITVFVRDGVELPPDRREVDELKE